MRNDPVPLDALNATAPVPLEALAPRFPRYQAVTALVFWVLMAALAAVVLPRFGPVGPLASAALASGLLVVGAVTAWVAVREARRRGWALRAFDLLHSSGLLVQRTTVLPLCRVQHVETASGPLERRFGLARLIVYTAGGASADLVIAGLSPETAQRLREHLLARIRGTGDRPPAEAPGA